MSAPRWMRALSRRGAILLSHAGSHAVFAGPDRRRRPLARLTPAQMREAETKGWLARSGDGYTLSAAGHVARCHTNRSPMVQQCRLVERPVMRECGRIETVTANALEGPLGKWSGLLGPAECNAAERFLADYHRSSLTQRTTRNWSPTAPRRGEGPRRGPDDATLGAIAAKDRVFKVLDALGPQLAKIVEAALIREESLAAMERRFGWGQRSGGTAVKLALGRLAEIYGSG
ncbi:MAG: hypothetical protein CMH94_03640 [Oceanicaulis sp.]|nr:hypothetical protein [Oceanicaulis sp.]MBI74674.1 hypothetical protein [Oceanicaulis sp.]